MNNKRVFLAGLAMQALISKFPMLYTEGKSDLKEKNEYQDNFKKELANNAWEYADLMLSTESK